MYYYNLYMGQKLVSIRLCLAAVPHHDFHFPWSNGRSKQSIKYVWYLYTKIMDNIRESYINYI